MVERILAAARPERVTSRQELFAIGLEGTVEGGPGDTGVATAGWTRGRSA
jgi:hypothetical protein